MNTEKPLQDAVKHHIDEKDALNRKAQAANCAATVLADECGKLRKRFAELVDKATNQAERIRYLEGATNHAGGTPLSKAKARIAELEAKLAESRNDSGVLLLSVCDALGKIDPDSNSLVAHILTKALPKDYENKIRAAIDAARKEASK